MRKKYYLREKDQIIKQILIIGESGSRVHGYSLCLKLILKINEKIIGKKKI